jgi:outer membrane receptor protein involved in Fe transport
MSALSTAVAAQESAQGAAKPVDLTSISLEDLKNIQVTSASKKAESLFAAPAAIFVITGEDIRRGGFSSVPDALRTVPGLYVVQSTFRRSWLMNKGGKPTVWNSYWNTTQFVDGPSPGITELRGASPAGTEFPVIANNPKHEANFQSKLDLTQFVNFDALYFYNNAITQLLPPLNRVDVGLSSKPIGGFTFSMWGRNLQQYRHQEAIPQSFLGGEIRRSVVFKAIWEPDEGSRKAAH